MTKRKTIKDLLNNSLDFVTVRGGILAAVFAAVVHVGLSWLGYNAGEQAVLFSTPRKVAMDAETAKLILTALGAVLGVLADKYPEILEYLRALKVPAGDSAVLTRLEEIKADTAAIKEKTDKLP